MRPANLANVKLRVGLTGGIGSGKSEVAKIFEVLGAYVIDADRLAREAVERGTPGFARVAERFPQAIRRDGTIDRAVLASIVFHDSDARDALGAIVHPEVRRLGAACEAHAGAEQIVVHDVPLLFEAGFYRHCDANVLVVADEETRIGRIVVRGLSPDDARQRMKAQIDPDRARELADYTLDNDGTIDALVDAVREVYADLRERLPAVSKPTVRQAVASRPAPHE
ncbi:MAG: hypothetical protein NVS2B3_08340 [Vulcanimicrobiaceae bacterium]